jgi:GT2 family glycosyltransferase
MEALGLVTGTVPSDADAIDLFAGDSMNDTSAHAANATALIRAEASISVVIPTYNRPHLVDRCLRALLIQAQAPEEVVVVNDASADATRTVLRAWQRRALPFALRVVDLSENGGPSRARNRGVQDATGDWLAFTDDDCEPEADWIKALASQAGAVSPTVAGIGGAVLPAAHGLVADYMTVNRILDPPPSCSYLVTANCMFRRAVFLAVGGFNEKLSKPGGEDPGLSFAVTDAGYELSFCPGATVRHHYRESAMDFIKTFYRYGRGVRHVMGR